MVTRVRLLPLIGLLACMFGLPSQVNSTTVLELTTEEMAVRAETILHGRVITAESRFDESGKRIYTEYRLEVEELLKGESQISALQAREFTVRQWGGVVDDPVHGTRGFYIPGVATFAVDEDVFAFFAAENPATGTRFTVGLSQGKYSVRQELATGRDVLQRNLRGLNFYDPSTRELHEPVLDEKPVYLSGMRDEVMRVLRREERK